MADEHDGGPGPAKRRRVSGSRSTSPQSRGARSRSPQPGRPRSKSPRSKSPRSKSPIPEFASLRELNLSSQIADDIPADISRMCYAPAKWTQKTFLGCGSFGAVVAATTPGGGGRPSERVVIKVLNTEQIPNAENALRELYNLAFFSRHAPHPNLIQLQDVWYCKNLLHIVLPRFDLTLDVMVDRRRSKNGPHNPTFALSGRKWIAMQIAAGLAHIHVWAVHRDVKTQNVVVRGDFNDLPNMKVSLIDLGSARRLEDAGAGGRPPLTSAGQVSTQGYRAPETYTEAEIRDGEMEGEGTRTYSHKSDMFSFACIWSEMVTGAELFKDRSTMQLLVRLSTSARREWLRRQHWRRNKPNPLDAEEETLLNKMLAPDADERPSAAAVYETLHSKYKFRAGMSAPKLATEATRKTATHQEPAHSFSRAGLTGMQKTISAIVLECGGKTDKA